MIVTVLYIAQIVRKYLMVLENRLNITDAVELARVEERVSKAKAKKLFERGKYL